MGYFNVAKKTDTASPQKPTQRYKWYATAMQKTNNLLVSQILPWLHELIYLSESYCSIQNVDQTNIYLDNVFFMWFAV